MQATQDVPAQLWNNYLQDRSISNRNALVEFYIDFACCIARKAVLTNTAVSDADDHVSDAMVGLIAAIESFDPSNAASFKTYAVLRIRGEVIDGVRRVDIVPRSRRTREKTLGLDAAKCITSVIAADHSFEDGPEIVPVHTEDCSAEIEALDELRWLTSGLTQSQRQIIEGQVAGHTLKKAGQLIGLTESRASQLRSEGVERMKSKKHRQVEHCKPDWQPIERKHGSEFQANAEFRVRDPEECRAKIAELEQELEAWKETLKRIERQKNGGSDRSTRSNSTQSKEC